MTSNTLCPSDLVRALARAGDRLGSIGAPLIWCAETGSTNDEAMRLAEQGATDGTLVLAEAQTDGRGRRERGWSSPAGAGIYASLVLRPPAHAMPLVTIAAGVALADGIAAATGLAPSLKWPNDVCIVDELERQRKLAGILAEAGASGDGHAHVILGFGVNVLSASYPPDVAARATSLEGELGRPVDRHHVLVECLAAWSRRYRQLHAGDVGSVVHAWRSRAAATLGRRVRFESSGAIVGGVAEDIDGAGALLVRTERGVVRVVAGDVTWM